MNSPFLTIIDADPAHPISRLAGRMACALGMEYRRHKPLDFPPEHLADVSHLLLIAAALPNGEADESLEALWMYLSAELRPNLSHLRFSVLSLGTEEYPCTFRCGCDFDHMLAACGASRIAAPVCADIGDSHTARLWLHRTLQILVCPALWPDEQPSSHPAHTHS